MCCDDKRELPDQIQSGRVLNMLAYRPCRRFCLFWRGCKRNLKFVDPCIVRTAHKHQMLLHNAEREKEGERQRERERYRPTDRQTDRQTDRGKQTETELYCTTFHSILLFSQTYRRIKCTNSEAVIKSQTKVGMRRFCACSFLCKYLKRELIQLQSFLFFNLHILLLCVVNSSMLTHLLGTKCLQENRKTENKPDMKKKKSTTAPESKDQSLHGLNHLQSHSGSVILDVNHFVSKLYANVPNKQEWMRGVCVC